MRNWKSETYWISHRKCAGLPCLARCINRWWSCESYVRCAIPGRRCSTGDDQGNLPEFRQWDYVAWVTQRGTITGVAESCVQSQYPTADGYRCTWYSAHNQPKRIATVQCVLRLLFALVSHRESGIRHSENDSQRCGGHLANRGAVDIGTRSWFCHDDFQDKGWFRIWKKEYFFINREILLWRFRYTPDNFRKGCSPFKTDWL